MSPSPIQPAQARAAPSRPGAPRAVVLALFLAGFSTFSLLYCVQPLLPVFAKAFEVSPAESSLPLSLATGAIAAAILCSVTASERFGRRGLMFAAMIGAAVLNLGAAAAPGWGALLLCRTAEGFVLGGVPAVAMAYLAEEIEPGSLGAVMGIYVGGTAIGGMTGRLATGVLTDLFGWRGALCGIGIAGLLAAIGFRLLLPPSRNFVPRRGLDAAYHVRAWVGHAVRPPMLLLYLIGFTLMGAFVTVYNYAGFRLTGAPFHLSQTQLGLIFTAYIFGAGASYAVGALDRRLGRARVLVGALVVAAAGAALTLAPSLPGVVAGIVLLTIGFFAAHPTAGAWVGRLASQQKGHAASLYMLSIYLGSSVLGSAGGWFLAAAGWPGVVGFVLTLLAIAAAASIAIAGLERSGP